MAKLWTNYHEISEFAKWAAKTYEIEVVTRRVDGGWILPFYTAAWNLVNMNEEELLNYERVKDEAYWDDYKFRSRVDSDRFDDDQPLPGDRATYGLAPMLEDTVAAGFHEFSESWIED